MKRFVFIGLLFLIGCTPIKRLERLHKKHPYIFETVKDTVKYEGETEVQIKGFEFADTFKIMDVHQRYKHLNTTLDLVYKDSNVFFNLKADDTTVKARYNGEVTVNKYEVKAKNQISWQTKALIITMIFVTVLKLLFIYRLKASQ